MVYVQQGSETPAGIYPVTYLCIILQYYFFLGLKRLYYAFCGLFFSLSSLLRHVSFGARTRPVQCKKATQSSLVPQKTSSLKSRKHQSFSLLLHHDVSLCIRYVFWLVQSSPGGGGLVWYALDGQSEQEMLLCFSARGQIPIAHPKCCRHSYRGVFNSSGSLWTLKSS